MRKREPGIGQPPRHRPDDQNEPVRTAERILVVDDDVAVRQMLGRILASEGYVVKEAADGAQALEMATQGPLDLLLLDLNMPVKNGWDTFERLTTANPFLPVIIITARPDQRFTAQAAGVGALLEKPLDFLKLLRTISALLAEAPEVRLARMAGHRAKFHYQPAQTRGRSP